MTANGAKGETLAQFEEAFGLSMDELNKVLSAALPEDDVTLTWIPYYAWDNRTPGEMRVWVREH